MRIAIDAMGGDHAPDEIVRGALLYRGSFGPPGGTPRGDRGSPREDRGSPGEDRGSPGEDRRSGGPAELVLVGREDEIHRLLGASAGEGIAVVDAREVVGMGEHPSTALRRRGGTSIGVATQLVKDGRADGVVSAGNTGATMAAALLVLGRIRGIDRPALCGMLPTTKRRAACLLDAGATMDATPQNVLQYAQMASRFMERVHRVERPSVGLLNVGEEPEKGGRAQLEAFALLSAASDLNFYGNVEGRDILKGTTDIVVTDGFTGNTVAKAMEGVVDVFTEGIKRDIFGGALGKLAALVAMPGIRRFRHHMDYEPYASAPLLGVAGVSVVTHGRARARMVKLAIDVAERSIATGLIEAIGAGTTAATA